MPTPTLRPIEEFDGSTPLIALDFDGVLNRFHRDQPRSGEKMFVGPQRKLVRTAHGAKYQVDWDDATVDALVALIAKHQLELGWLTSWGPNMLAVIEQAFDGRLGGGYILKKIPPMYRKHRPADWKFTGLRDRVAQTRQPWVWADDEAVSMARLSQQFDDTDTIADVGGLPLVTDEHYGLTLAQVAEADAFLSGQPRT